MKGVMKFCAEKTSGSRNKIFAVNFVLVWFFGFHTFAQQLVPLVPTATIGEPFWATVHLSEKYPKGWVTDTIFGFTILKRTLPYEAKSGQKPVIHQKVLLIGTTPGGWPVPISYQRNQATIDSFHLVLPKLDTLKQYGDVRFLYAHKTASEKWSFFLFAIGIICTAGLIYYYRKYRQKRPKSTIETPVNTTDWLIQAEKLNRLVRSHQIESSEAAAASLGLLRTLGLWYFHHPPGLTGQEFLKAMKTAWPNELQQRATEIVANSYLVLYGDHKGDWEVLSNQTESLLQIGRKVFKAKPI